MKLGVGGGGQTIRGPFGDDVATCRLWRIPIRSEILTQSKDSSREGGGGGDNTCASKTQQKLSAKPASEQTPRKYAQRTQPTHYLDNCGGILRAAAAKFCQRLADWVHIRQTRTNMDRMWPKFA